MTSPSNHSPTDTSVDRGDAPADRTAGRAELLPEEQAFEIQDPTGLADEILAESDERTDDPDRGA